MAKSLTRLARLEAAAAPHLQAAQDDMSTDEDWVELYAAMGREGRFATEPDFPAALAFYRAAVLRAKAQAEPPFDPPPYFLPNLLGQPGRRCFYWRTHVRFPEVGAGREWLYEIDSRCATGTPPVTEAEFHDLARWLEAHAERLRQSARQSDLLVVGEGKLDSVANLLYGGRQGPRRNGAGVLAQKLRWLRAQHGDGA